MTILIGLLLIVLLNGLLLVLLRGGLLLMLLFRDTWSGLPSRSLVPGLLLADLLGLWLPLGLLLGLILILLLMDWFGLMLWLLDLWPSEPGS